MTGEIEKAVLAARTDGTGRRKIAKQLGVGVSTVNRIITKAAQIDARFQGVKQTSFRVSVYFCFWLSAAVSGLPKRRPVLGAKLT